MNEVLEINIKNLPSAYKELLGQLDPDTLNTYSRPQGVRRLSIRGRVFRKVMGKEELTQLNGPIKAVIVKTAPLSRIYYDEPYVEGQTSPPTCWSADTNTGRPSDDVLEESAQATSCVECPQNIKGSGANDSKACRYRQSIAILLADNDGMVVSKEVYQLSLPATSIFAKDDTTQKMGLQAYARFLSAQERPVPPAALLTEISFDPDKSVPTLNFKPLRVLEEAELALAIEVQQAPETARLIALSTPKLIEGAPPPVQEKVAATPTKEVPPVEEVIEEPKVKAVKNKKPVPTEEVDLASMLDDFDD